MASVASQFIEEVTAHAQSDSLEDVREICADSTYFPNNLGNCMRTGMVPQNVGGYAAGRIILCWRTLSYSSIRLPGVKWNCSMPDDCTCCLLILALTRQMICSTARTVLYGLPNFEMAKGDYSTNYIFVQ